MSADQRKQFYLYPGNLMVSKDPYCVTTILGSCVALVLWDPYHQFGGINHYMMPFWNGDGLATPRYGSIAAEKLLTRMLDLGSKKEHLVAKIFGGARVLQTKNTRLDIGKNNVLFIESFLKEQKIEIKARHTGGEQGRKLKFQSDTGVVMMKLLNKTNYETTLQQGK